MPSRHRAPADVEEALAALGVEVIRSTDDEILGRCPAHLRRTGKEDRHPSWSVNRESGLHNCYSCGFRGTFLELVMYLEFPNDVFRAARWLRQFGVSLVKAQELVPYDEREVEEQEILLVPETKLAMYDEVPDWALEARMLTREAVDHYEIRWNSKRDSWIIPVRRPEGDLVGWQEKWQKERRFHNEPRDMVKSDCLFGYGVFPVGEPAVLLESPLDVVRLYSAGWEGGLSTYGAAWSKRQMHLIAAVTDELVGALDDDRDGRLYSEKLRVGEWERGKLIEPGWAGRLHLRFFDYGKTGEKDLGGMNDQDIARGLYDAQHSSVARFGTLEQEKARRGVRRGAQAVSGTRRRADGRPRSVPADRRSRHR